MQKCCIIIPCYNEAKRILENEFLSFVNENSSIDLLFVNDGSNDNTIDVLQKLSQKHPQIAVLDLTKNLGKAEAVRAGFLQALKNVTYNYIAFLDADLAIPLDEFIRLLDFTLKNPQLEFTYLSKIRRVGAAVNQPYKRFLMGRILSFMTRLSLNLPVYDTQCGCKLFSRNIASKIFETPFISAWLFDIELFWRILNLKNRAYFDTNTQEVPLNRLVDRGSSKVSGKALFKLPVEFFKIHRTYKK
ncbi:MAG: glycosyltransferase [Flavobacteriales bacterium]